MLLPYVRIGVLIVRKKGNLGTKKVIGCVFFTPLLGLCSEHFLNSLNTNLTSTPDEPEKENQCRYYCTYYYSFVASINHIT